jgi:polyisoprenoid-binding protein YceI
MKHLSLALALLVTSLAQAQLTNGNHSLSLAESLITWKVDYSIGTKGHEGTLKLSSGTMLIQDGIIQGGSFIIDMNSVHVTDMKPDDGGKDLEDHLKSADFLTTADHPKGYFTVLNSVRNASNKYTVSGYLILKGISNTITFPATITETNTTLVVKAEFLVNRTLWGINYNSGSIFNLMKDEIISDQMNTTLHFVFKKAQ